MTIWMVLLCLPGLFAAPNRAHTHRQAHFQIQEIAEGPDGLLYLAGPSGLYSFDGFRYAQVTSYPFPIAYEVATTKGGVLWAGSKLHGLAYRQESGSFRVVLKDPYHFATAVGRFMVVQTKKNQLSRFDEAGGSTAITIPAPMWPVVSGNELWLNYYDQGAVFRLDPERMRLVPVPGVTGQNMTVARDPSGTIWALHEKGVRAFKGGRVLKDVEGRIRHRQTLIAGRAGQIWYQDQDRIRGLYPPIEFAIGHTSLAALLEDRRGHVWAGSADGRLSELVSDTDWEQWPIDGFDGEAPIQVFREAGGGLVCASRRHLYRYSAGGAGWRKITSEPRDYAHVLPLQGGRFLASDRSIGLVRLAPDASLNEVIFTPGSYHPRLRAAFRKLAPGPNGQVLVGNRMAFFTLDGGLLHPASLPDVSGHPEANDFERDPDGRLWVGYEAGLAVLQQDGSWRRLVTDLPLPMVRSFGIGRDEFWVAHRLSGYFSRVRNGKVTRFSSDQGYEPADTAFLKVDRRGWIWRGTSKGVYVSNGHETDPEDWLFLEVGNCTSHYGFFEDRDGTVWIGSNTGVTHVRPDDSWFADAGMPVISRALVGDQVLPDLPQALDRTTRVAVEFSRLGLPNFRQQPIRYRLSPQFSEWRVARDGRIEMLDLTPGTYQLEVKRAGSNSVLRRSFTWNTGPSWSSYWWTALLICVSVGAWAFTQREWIGYSLGKWVYLTRIRFEPGHNPGRIEERGGQTLNGRYRLQALISRSGFADVYEAEHERDGGRLVVKVLHHRSGDAAWVRARFAQEVAALHSVKHPFVIPLLDSWINSSGEPCLAFPLIEGETLRETISSGRLPPESAARLIENLGDALGALHKAGVIHRDLKPENIILRPDGTPVLIDLGSSGLLGSEERSAVSRILAGSVDYLAPERLTGCYSPASDVYSFAATVYELLTREKFAETNLVPAADDFPQALAQRLKGSLPPATIVHLASALAGLPDRRPTDAAVWARQISSTLAGGPSPSA